MRKIFIGIGIFFALICLTILVLPSLVPSSLYKSTIEQQISAKLGRSVQISGDVELSVFPALRANAGTVTIANDDGFSANPFITMDSLQANLKLLPLFKKQVEITKFTLIRPKISLERLKNGSVNWNFGEQNGKTPQITEQKPSPFKRNGRYTDLQISLGVFTLQNGQILYTDAQKNITHTLKSVNTKIAMQGMDKPITAKGNLILNDIPMNIDTRLESLKTFFGGQTAPFFITLKSELITLIADGKFTPSKDLTFDIKFDGDIPSVARLDKLFGIKNPYGDLTERAQLKATLAFDGMNLVAKNAVLSFGSSILATDFTGDFTAGPKPTASGNLAINISDPYKLQETLGFNYPRSALLNSVQLSTKLTTNGVVTKGEAVVLNLKGDLIDANYTGRAIFDNALSLDGKFEAKSPAFKALSTKLGVQASQGMDLIDSFDARGRVNGIVDRLSLSEIEFNSQSAQLNTTYQGGIKLGQSAILGGRFTAQGPSIPALVKTAGISTPRYINALGNLDVSGQVSGTMNAFTLTTLDFKSKGNDLTASYFGELNTADGLKLNGNFETFSPSFKALAAKTGITTPYADAIGALTAKGNLAGSIDNLSISNLDANLSQGLVNLQFNGKAQTGKALSYAGNLNTNITSLRELAALGDIQLATSTGQGEVYGPFSLSGQTIGSAKNISFNNAHINIDNIVGTGSFSADLTALKPMVTGILDLNGLDLRPYMAAQNPSGKIQPWKEDPLNLSAFKMFNADFTLKTPNILINRLKLGPSQIKVLVKNGALTTNIPNVSLYGGNGDLDMTVNANAPITKVALDFTLKDVDGKGFLGAAAGFTKLTGNTGTTMTFRGSGRSQAEIMRSLTGNGDFELAEGVVSGVDIGQFVGGLDSALQTRTLPAGIGNTYSTPFDKLAGLFTITNGVLTVGDFNLNSDTISADGSGTINIGQQIIDFSLQPRLKEAKGLAGFGIPIKFSGNFGSVRAGLDTTLLGNIFAAKARAKLQSEISNQIDGGIGDVIGSVIGGQTAPNTQNQTQQPTQQSKPKPAEPQTPDQLLGGILGDILGTPQQTEPQKTQSEEQKKQEEKQEEKKQEDPLEQALKDIFGGG